MTKLQQPTTNKMTTQDNGDDITWKSRAKAAEQVVDELHEHLANLLTASSPYLKRKKETPRAECKTLNDVHTQIREWYT